MDSKSFYKLYVAKIVAKTGFLITNKALIPVRSRVRISPLLNKKDRFYACLFYLACGIDENSL